jgi:16S rRNA (cytosine967-C5)-methyltransferase
VLRNKNFFTDFAEAGGGPTMRRLTILGLADAVGAESLGGLTEEEVEWLERIMQIDRNLMPPNMRANMPKWLFDKLVAQFGEEETCAGRRA